MTFFSNLAPFKKISQSLSRDATGKKKRKKEKKLKYNREDKANKLYCSFIQ